MAHPMLLLVWLAVGLALAQKPSYQVFKQQHIDYPRTWVNPYCDRMMQNRGMTTPVCKVYNTFIHASETDVINVCGSGGISIRAFSLTNCRLTGATQRPPCRYQELPGNNKIRIACEGGLPVHFDGIIP